MRSEPIGFVISTKDITARKRQRKHTQPCRKKQRCDHYRSGQYNKICQFQNGRRTGFPLGEAVVKPMTEILRQSTFSNLDRHIRRIRGESLPDKYEAEIMSHDGEIIPVEISVSVIQFDGKPATVSIARDVRDAILAQGKLKRVRGKIFHHCRKR